jgi:hypothetical protein
MAIGAKSHLKRNKTVRSLDPEVLQGFQNPGAMRQAGMETRSLLPRRAIILSTHVLRVRPGLRSGLRVSPGTINSRNHFQKVVVIPAPRARRGFPRLTVAVPLLAARIVQIVIATGIRMIATKNPLLKENQSHSFNPG